jgi:2-phospho-L-lactate guanylyltransferase
MLQALCSVRGLDRVVVVTADEQIADQAQSCGVEVFLEIEQHSHSRSADAAAQRAIEMGATSVVMLPIDVPLAKCEEIEALIDAAGPGVVVPSGDGTGTNALMRNPPNAIRACFGPGSFRKHCNQAESRGLPLKVMRPRGNSVRYRHA